MTGLARRADRKKPDFTFDLGSGVFDSGLSGISITISTETRISQKNGFRSEKKFHQKPKRPGPNPGWAVFVLHINTDIRP